MIYLDESGFESEPLRTHAWSKKGKEILGEKLGSRKTRTNLITAKKGKDF